MDIYKSMTAVMAELSAIGKDSKNTQQGFAYRGIDQVYNNLHPILSKHQIFTTPEVICSNREERTNAKGTVLAFVTLTVRYTFWAADGSSVSCTVNGEGMDSGDKATNKALAIAHKYALLQTFCIPTEDMVDPDAQSHEVQPRNVLSAVKLARMSADFEALITEADSLEALKSAFAAAYRELEQSPELQAKAKASYDARKIQLSGTKEAV